MSRKDAITGKGAMYGNTRSFSMNHSRRTWGLNLQKATVKCANGKTKTIRVSARTLKGLKRDNKLA
jgi:large subunit ribosomal protein L28